MLVHFYLHAPKASFGYPDKTVKEEPLAFGKLYLFSPNQSELAVLVETSVFLLGEYQKKLPGVRPLKKVYLSDKAYSASSLFAIALQQGLPNVLNRTSNPSQGTLSVHLPVFYCPESPTFIEAFWQALGYEVQVETIPWNADFPDWGGSSYHALTLTTSLPFEWVLRHLCTLLPVCDDHKFEWLTPIQIEHFKLCAEVWLKGHPMLSEILRRYNGVVTARPLPQKENNLAPPFEKGGLGGILGTLNAKNPPQSPFFKGGGEQSQVAERSLQLLLHATQQTIRLLKDNPQFCTFTTPLIKNIPVKTKDLLGALDVFLSAAANPTCLFYNPPTMAFPLSSLDPTMLEHPQEIFDYYKRVGLTDVICQEKHMGKRRTFFICQTPEEAQQKFYVSGRVLGFRLPRITQGSLLFEAGLPIEKSSYEGDLISYLSTLLSKINFWEEYLTNWVYLDCEELPWTASNDRLPFYRQINIRPSTAGLAHTGAVLGLLSQMAVQGISLENLTMTYQQAHQRLLEYLASYRPFCSAVDSFHDLKLAPFNILATEGRTYFDKTHQWHLETIQKMVVADQNRILIPTEYRMVNLQSPQSIQAAINWWENILLHGGEGMIVKPLHFVEQNEKGLIQPAIKCRGPNYLKLVYGPDYSTPENLLLLKQKRMTGLKERLAFQEFALGIEALERFVRNEPVEKVFECVLASLALDYGYRT